jgi:hypothetical protein
MRHLIDMEQNLCYHRQSMQARGSKLSLFSRGDLNGRLEVTPLQAAGEWGRSAVKFGLSKSRSFASGVFI